MSYPNGHCSDKIFAAFVSDVYIPAARLSTGSWSCGPFPKSRAKNTCGFAWERGMSSISLISQT